jgi:hypothetical protein
MGHIFRVGFNFDFTPLSAANEVFFLLQNRFDFGVQRDV